MRGTVGQLQERLAAAGVGHRPTIFVCHRWVSTLEPALDILGWHNDLSAAHPLSSSAPSCPPCFLMRVWCWPFGSDTTATPITHVGTISAIPQRKNVPLYMTGMRVQWRCHVAFDLHGSSIAAACFSCGDCRLIAGTARCNACTSYTQHHCKL